jgi:NTE family protein
MSNALVLSGGGAVGIAWEVGLAAGLAGAGVDLGTADLVVGTSAGSAVGARLALGWDMEEQLARYRRQGETVPVAGAPAGSVAAPPDGSVTARMQKFLELMAKAGDSAGGPEEGRAEIGRFALEADAGPEEAFVDSFRYLRGLVWPDRFRCTAVEATTGAFVTWDGTQGEELQRAVASSCAVPGVFPPVTIGGRRYMDGGVRSATCADLARGHDRVLIVSLVGTSGPAGGGSPAMDARTARFRAHLESELAELASGGSEVEIVSPDPAAARTFGLNMMDAGRGPAAAEAGYAQGGREAGRLASFWSAS